MLAHCEGVLIFPKSVQPIRLATTLSKTDPEHTIDQASSGQQLTNCLWSLNDLLVLAHTQT